MQNDQYPENIQAQGSHLRVWFKFHLIGSFSNLGMLRISRLYFNTRGELLLSSSLAGQWNCPVYINRINIICTEEVQMEDEPFRISLYLLCSLCCFWITKTSSLQMTFSWTWYCRSIVFQDLEAPKSLSLTNFQIFKADLQMLCVFFELFFVKGSV